MAQADLLKSSRFGPFFCTQFLGAFNDNVFKNALIIIITFQIANLSSEHSSTLVNFCMGLFILPFFLFSATAGQLADKYEKSHLIRYVKLLEIIIMFIASIGLYFHSIYFLLFVLFLLGTQAAFFGPVKYGILPQHLHANELVAGNGLVEMGTFIAILLGTMVGGVLISIETYGWIIVALVLLLVAFGGWLSSLWIPLAPPFVTDLKMNWNPITQTCKNLQYSYENKTVFYAIIANSWFWFYGSVFLAQLPNYIRYYLNGNEYVVTLFLVLFSIGIGIGSLLCDRLSKHQVEPGLVLFGSLGLSVFAVSLFFLNGPHPSIIIQPQTLMEFLLSVKHWLVIFNVIILGVFGGFFIVPIYALIQERSEKSYRARIIAANNILNALFMVMAALFAILLLKTGITITELFFITGIINALLMVFICRKIPEFSQRFLDWGRAFFKK